MPDKCCPLPREWAERATGQSLRVCDHTGGGPTWAPGPNGGLKLREGKTSWARLPQSRPACRHRWGTCRPEVGVDVGSRDELRSRIKERGSRAGAVGDLGSTNAGAVHIEVHLTLVSNSQAYQKRVLRLHVNRGSINMAIDGRHPIAALPPETIYYAQKASPSLSGNDRHDRSPPGDRATPRRCRTVHPMQTRLDLSENTVEHRISSFGSILHIHTVPPSPCAPCEQRT